MTKYAELYSLEHGLRQAIAILGDRGIEDALQDVLGLRRSASLIRKCADPDNDANQIQHRYSVALDAACVKAGHLPPLLEAHRQLLLRLTKQDAKQARGKGLDLASVVLLLQGALGHLAEAVIEAQRPDSPAGRRLTNREKHEVFEAVLAIEEQTASLKRLLKE